MWNNTEDCVDAHCDAMTAEALTEWLVKYHHLPEVSARTVSQNLRQQFRWHRLQGRLDRYTTLAVLAQLLGLRQSVKSLKTPEQ